MIFRKYSPMGDLQELASQMCESVSAATGHITAIADRDGIIALHGAPRKELLDKPNSPELEKMMEQRKNYLYQAGENPIPASRGEEKYHLGAASPILSQGDLMGSVLLLLGENEFAQLGAGKVLFNTSIGPGFDSAALEKWLDLPGTRFFCDTRAAAGPVAENFFARENVRCANVSAGRTKQAFVLLSKKVLDNLRTALGE